MRHFVFFCTKQAVCCVVFDDSTKDLLEKNNIVTDAAMNPVIMPRKPFHASTASGKSAFKT